MSKSTDKKNEKKFIELTKFKSLENETGGFSGYGNNFGVLDSWDDITLPGCFADAVKEFEETGFGGADHAWGISSEIGIVHKAFEDAVGLFVEVGYHPTADAQLVREKVNHRLANGKKCCLSIGYRVLKDGYEYVVGEEAAPFLKNPSQEVLDYLKERQPLVRLLKKVKLYEVSVVSVGANCESEITQSKSARAEEHKRLISLDDLRDASEASGGNVSRKLQLLNLKLRTISAQ